MTTMPHSDLSDSPLEQLGIYRVESLLGQGGMGEVYLAWDELLQRRVAIKRVRTDRLGDETQRARFLREARAVARLDHPAIVRVYHILERDESHCLVMEYVQGRDLAKIVGDGLVSVPRAAAIGRDIAEGLAAAHDQGLVHRDLKLANVMITDDERVKILDFGLAKTFSTPDAKAPDAEEDALTRSDMIVGTAHAMSPEQAAGEPVDHRSDLFALGSLLYELLSGRGPFRGNHVMDSLRRVLTVEPEPIGKLLPSLPPEFANLIGALLAKAPAQRPVNAHRVAERLAGIVQALEKKKALHKPALVDPDVPTADFPPPARQPQKSWQPQPTQPPTPASDSGPVLRTVAQVNGPVIETARELMFRFNAAEVAQSDGLFLFQRPAEAVAFALALHSALDQRGQGQARIGVLLGEILVPPEPKESPSALRLRATGEALELAALLAQRARPRQTLLGRGVFDLVRSARSPEELIAPEVRWLAHGTYFLEGHEDPFEIFEVGLEGLAPLAEPPDSGKTKRASTPTGAGQALGWRPAAGQAVPRRANWSLEQRLGEGGFGEVWLARHPSGDERVFKFCFDAEKLRSLKREVTLFRLMRETLGHRRDIARILDWDFDEAPYFLESEYGDDLLRWAERQGGLAEVPLATRLELAAGIADALAAAHSVGVLHKDVKPSNVLVNHDADGRPYARLADFGIGRLMDAGSLTNAKEGPGVVIEGFTQTVLDDDHGGTVRYMAPELLGQATTVRAATVQADVYALGVTLFQLVVGDFDRPVAPGWRREVDDVLLVEDIAACVDGSPERRLRGAADLAERLRSLPERRRERQAEVEARRAFRQAARRRRMASTLGVAAAIMMVLISVFAYQAVQAKNRELEARQNAEQRRRQAEDLIDFMLGDLRSELQPLGKLDILDKVGNQAMEYFATVPEGELSDEETASYARALDQIGQVRFALGEMNEAAAAFRQSLSMTQELAARNPEDPELQFALGQSHFWVGYSHWEGRDADAALEQFEAYRDVSERLVENDPENLKWQRELAYSYSNLGQLFEEEGRLLEASRALEANARIIEGLSLRAPEDGSLTVSLANAYAKLGRVAEHRGELAQARLRFEASLDLTEQACAADPEDMELQASKSRALFHVGKILLMQGESSSALGYFRNAVEVGRRPVAHEPDHQGWRIGLAIDVNQTAKTLLDLGDINEAKRLSRESHKIAKAFFGQDPDHTETRYLYARTLWTKASIAMHQGELRAAQADFQTVATILKKLIEESESHQYRLWLLRALEKLGATTGQLGEPERATAIWEHGAQIARDLVAVNASPEPLDFLVRMLVLTQRNEEARPLIERLAAMGYNRETYLDFLPDTE